MLFRKFVFDFGSLFLGQEKGLCDPQGYEKRGLMGNQEVVVGLLRRDKQLMSRLGPSRPYSPRGAVEGPKMRHLVGEMLRELSDPTYDLLAEQFLLHNLLHQEAGLE